jgi:large subunit ribosomal protein L4
VARRRPHLPEYPEENFTQKVNRKMYRAGLAAILSQLAREDRLAVIEDFAMEAPKTRLFARS